MTFDVIGAAIPEGVVHVGNSVGRPPAHHSERAKTERRSDIKVLVIFVAKSEEVCVARIDADPELAICTALYDDCKAQQVSIIFRPN